MIAFFPYDLQVISWIFNINQRFFIDSVKDKISHLHLRVRAFNQIRPDMGVGAAGNFRFTVYEAVWIGTCAVMYNRSDLVYSAFITCMPDPIYLKLVSFAYHFLFRNTIVVLLIRTGISLFSLHICLWMMSSKDDAFFAVSGFICRGIRFAVISIAS